MTVAKGGWLSKVLFWMWFGGITVVSLLGGESFAKSQLLWTTSGVLEHFLGYGLLGILAMWAFRTRRAVVILVVVFGVSIGFEVIQVLFLGRTLGGMDITGNGLGILTGAVIGWQGGRWLRM